MTTSAGGVRIHPSGTARSSSIFDDLGARIVCSSTADCQPGGGLAKLVKKQIVQGEPVRIENLEVAADNPEQHFDPNGFFGKKLNGLRGELERQVVKFELGLISGVASSSLSTSSTLITVKHRVVELD